MKKVIAAFVIVVSGLAVARIMDTKPQSQYYNKQYAPNTVHRTPNRTRYVEMVDQNGIEFRSEGVRYAVKKINEQLPIVVASR